MQANLPLSIGRRLSARSALAAAVMASASLLHCGHASAASLIHALNPQPLPPGLYSPSHLGPVGGPTRAPFVMHPARQVCVAWGRVCVKVGRGSPTHEAPCGQYVYVCRKYG